VRFVSASFGYFVPYALPIADREITVNVAVYDETFFRDIGYAETAPLLFPASDTFRGDYTIREVLAEAVDGSASSASGVIALLGLAFAYGLLHALGPGHRKMALAAYFVARPSHPLQGVTAGASVAFLHAAAAVAIIYGLYYLFQSTVTTTFASVSSILELASYTAIILSSGIVPCPGTALILIFCLSRKLPWIGVLAALAMSVGMAVVTMGVSLAAVLGKRGLLSALPRGSRLSGLFHHGLEIGGAMLIVVFGLLMLSPYLIGLPA
jgi:ABC-type nickel/cobalt efflux system permease component RcnA